MRAIAALLPLASACLGGAPSGSEVESGNDKEPTTGLTLADDADRDDDIDEDVDEDVLCDSPGPITLTLTHEGQPGAGVRVLFQGCNSAVLADVVTDANGVAEGQVTAGGFVTVVEKTWWSKAVTFTDVAPGDALVVNGRVHHERPTEVPTTFIDFELIVPRVTAPIPVDYHVGASGCGGGTRPVSVETADTVTFGGTVNSRCAMPFDLIVHAEYAAYASPNGNGGPYHETLFVPGVTIAHGDTLDLTRLSYEALVAHSITVDLPSSGRDWWFKEALSSLHGVVHWTFSYSSNRYSSTPSVAADSTVTISAPQLPSPEAEFTLVSSSYQTPTTHEVMSVGTLGPSTTGQYNVDASALVLGDVPTCPVLDPAQRTVTWMTDSNGRVPTVVVVEIEPHPPFYPEWGSWKLVAPPDGRVRLPRLPDDIIDLDILNPQFLRTNVRRMHAATSHQALRMGATWPRDTYQWDLDESAMSESECFVPP